MNVSPDPVDLTIALHSRSGQTLLAPAMTIAGFQKLPLDIDAILSQMSIDVTGDFAEGSVSVYFVGKIMPITGQLTMSNPAKNLSFETEMVDNSPGLFLLPKQQHGLWWGLGGGRDARIAVTNTSGDAATADVFLDFQAERHAMDPLNFAPHETRVLSVVEMLGKLKVSPAEAPEGGITIAARGPDPALTAQGKIMDPATGFSTTLNFLDPSLQLASALHASGLPIGLPSKGSPYAGAGTFVPHVIVRNLLSAPQTATVTVEYPTADGPASTRLAPIPLAAFETKDFSLDAVMGQLPLPLAYASIRIEYSGAPGSAIAEVASVEAKSDLVIDGRLANEGDGWAGSGGNPWHLDDQTESVLFLTNMSDKDARIGFRLEVPGITYFISDLKLLPHETRAIDIRKLRDAQKPDTSDNKIPADATDGSVTWNRIDNVPVMGRMAVLKRRGGLASSYQCPVCPCAASFTGLEVRPSSGNVAVGSATQYTARAYYGGCVAGYYVDPASATWWTDSTSKATVNGSGAVTGASPGDTTVRASKSDFVYVLTGQYCSIGGYPTYTGSAAVHVGDATPVISFVTPSTWPAGVPRLVTISGSGFGSNPLVTISDPTVTKTILSMGNYQITMNVTVPAGNPGTTATITVTSQGLNGTGFIPVPGGGSQPNSVPYPVAETQVDILTNDVSRNYVFVGTSDSTVTTYNKQTAAGYPSPGRYVWSVSPETVTINPNNTTNAYQTIFTGNTPSASTGSTTETVNFYYPTTNTTDPKSKSRAITLRKFSALTTPSTKSGCQDVVDPPPITAGGYLTELIYNILTTPGSQQVESGFPGMFVTEIVQQTYTNYPNIPVNINQEPETATYQLSGTPTPPTQVVDCLGIPGPPTNPPLPSDYLICASQTITVGGIPVRSNTLKFTTTTVGIVSACP